MSPGDLVRTRSVKNHHNGVFRVYDTHLKMIMDEDSIRARTVVGKVPYGETGVFLETRGDMSRVLFSSWDVPTWIKTELLEVCEN